MKKKNKEFDAIKYILDLEGCFMYNEMIDNFIYQIKYIAT